MKIKLTILIEGNEVTLVDLENGSIEHGLEVDVFGTEEILEFHYENLEVEEKES